MIKLKNLKNIFYLHLLILVLLISCSDNAVELEEGGIGLIVPGKSIEGINLGDSKEVVEQKLGPPTSKGWSDGIYRSWRTYDYLEGPHSHLEINFLDYGADYGPVDAIAILEPYNGKTKEGIGIGSSLDEIHKLYGKPKNILSNSDQNWIADFYCFNQKKFEIHYIDSVVTTMSIGYFIPIEQDSLSACDNLK